MDRAAVRDAKQAPQFLALACVGFIAGAPIAHADSVGATSDNDPQDQRQDVVVTGKHAELQGPKAVAPVINTPRSVVILPKEIIEETGSTTLQEALRTVPGITFGAAEGGNPIGDRPFIRGFDSQGSIYVDGVRDPASSTREVFDVEQVQIVRGSDSTLGGRGNPGGSINIISKLPVADDFVSGAASYGNADYKRFTLDVNRRITDTVAVRLSAMGHDQDVAGRDALWQRRWGFAPSVTVGLGTPTRLTASYYYLESHELPDSGIPYRYTLANAPGTGEIADLPAIGTVTTAGGQTGTVDRSTFYGLANRDFRDTKTEQALLRVQHDFGGVTLRNSARWSHNVQNYIYTQPDDSQGDVYGTTTTNSTSAGVTSYTSGGYVWRRANTRYGYTDTLVDQIDLYGTFKTGAIEHSFAAGAEFAWEKARRGAYVLAGGSVSPRCTSTTLARYTCTSLFDPNPYDPWVNYASDSSSTAAAITKGGSTTETQNDGETQALYAFDSITLLPQLVLNLGARFDHFRSTVTLPVTTAPGLRLSRSDDLFNWQAGLVFKPTRQTSLYVSYATAATPPNSLLGEGSESNSLGTTAAAAAALDTLKVTKTKSFEVGAKASLFDDRLSVSLAGFQTKTDNARVTDENGNVGFIGKTRIRGIELGVNGMILPGWTVFGGYTYLDPVVVDGGYTTLTVSGQSIRVPSVTTGRQVPQTAKNNFTATTELTLFKRLSLGGTAIYMDKQYGGYQDNRSATIVNGVVTVVPATKVLVRQIPDYWRFDARVAYQLTPNVRLSVNAQNLTDKVYFTQAYASHYASIAPGRTVFGTVDFRF